MEDHKLSDVLLEESYILSFKREGDNILIVMHLMLENRKEGHGTIIFPNVISDKWTSLLGEAASLEFIEKNAKRYCFKDAPPDLGSIDVIENQGFEWRLIGDFGEAKITTKDTIPFVILDEYGT